MPGTVQGTQTKRHWVWVPMVRHQPRENESVWRLAPLASGTLHQALNPRGCWWCRESSKTSEWAPDLSWFGIPQKQTLWQGFDHKWSIWAAKEIPAGEWGHGTGKRGKASKECQEAWSLWETLGAQNLCLMLTPQKGQGSWPFIHSYLQWKASGKGMLVLLEGWKSGGEGQECYRGRGRRQGGHQEQELPDI